MVEPDRCHYSTRCRSSSSARMRRPTSVNRYGFGRKDHIDTGKMLRNPKGLHQLHPLGWGQARNRLPMGSARSSGHLLSQGGRRRSRRVHAKSARVIFGALISRERHQCLRTKRNRRHFARKRCSIAMRLVCAAIREMLPERNAYSRAILVRRIIRTPTGRALAHRELSDVSAVMGQLRQENG
jgi:hypothetical protein